MKTFAMGISGLVLLLAVVAVADDPKEIVIGDLNPAARTHPLNEKQRKLYLLKIPEPGKGTKEEHTKGRLLENRIYQRWEPRFFLVDEKTGERQIKGAWGLDITHGSAGFDEEPRTLLRMYSIIPAEWVGGPKGRLYQYFPIGEKFAENWRDVTDVPGATTCYTMAEFWASGKYTEKTFPIIDCLPKALEPKKDNP